MKQAQRKDFFREIGKSWSRFLSILLITALGVSFYAGVRSSEPDMRLTADSLYDETRFMDIRVVSTMGLAGEDLEAVLNVPGVEQVEAGMEAEALCEYEGLSSLLHIFSLGGNLNQVQVEKGRLPEQPGECFGDARFMERNGWEVGDSITLHSGKRDTDGTEEDILDTLGHTTYTIVGCGSYAKYLNLDRGTAEIGDGKPDGFLGLLLEEFYQDSEAAQAPIYHSIYVRVEGAEEENCYLDAYEDKVDEVIERIEEIAGERCQIRYEAIQTDAKQKLADARAEIADGEQKVADGETELADAEAELADAKADLADAEQKLADGRKELDDGWASYQEGLEEVEKNEADLADAERQLTDAREELRKQQETADAGRKEYEDGMSQLEAAEKRLASQSEQLEQMEEQFFAGFEAMGMTDREQILAYVKTDEELSAQYQQLEDGKAQIADGQAELAENRKVLEQSGQELTAGEEKLKEAGQTWQNSWNELQEGKQELAKARAELEEAKEELEEGEKEAADGEAELEDAKKEFAEKKAEAEEEMAEAREDLVEARKELEEARLEVADAEADLEDLELPEWIVLKRSDSVQTFIEFGTDAERIGAIGEVFPALFFLVAALVCLTTMTRMVEEERTQIGTMKALGYSKASIASKYILYALSACLLGGVIGAVGGSYLYPYVIIKAYQILYIGLPEPVMLIHADQAVIAILIAVFCTVAATALSCYKELAGVPAELMRPEAPKQGKRVLLERVGFFWKHLSFTWKSSLRNLFRYKKRLFMTIFGIGGSMSLLMVGFGLRDSIQEIVNNQYQQLWTYDAQLSVDEGKSEEVKQNYRDELEETLPEVEESLYIRTVAMDVEANGVTKNVNLFVPERLDGLEQFLVLRDRLSDEHYTLKEGGAVITEKLAKLLELSVGDTIYLMKNETEKLPVKVEAISENYMYHYVYLAKADYQQMFGEEPEYNQLLLKLSELSESRKTELSELLLNHDIVQSMTLVEDLEETVANMMHSLNLVIWVLIVAAGLLAFIILYNLNNISMMERRRELATIKVLGFYDIEVAEYVYRENILLTGLGILAGVVMGLVLHQYVIRTCEIDMIMFGRSIKLPSYLYSMLLTGLFAMAVNFGMFFKLRKIDMVESLKSVE